MSSSFTDRAARLAAACSLLLALTPLAQAQDRAAAGPSLADNAALKYWQAFAQLPQWNEQQNRIIGDWSTVPLDADAQAVVDGSRAALLYLHRGAQRTNCDWGLDLDDGPGLLMPHVSKARELARLAGLRARRELARGNQAPAVQDIGAGLALARHVGSDNILISVLVQAAIQNLLVDLAAEHLVELDAEALRALADQVERLPPGGSVKGSMGIEQQYFVIWFREKLRTDGARAVEQVPEAKAALEAAGGVAGALAELDAIAKFYDEAIRVADLPPGQRREAYEDLERRYSDKPMSKLFLPAYSRAIDAEARANARLAMLQAAIAVRYGGGPFTYRERPQGFELVSKLAIDGQPVTLPVGPADAADKAK
jgi:hypothetical protein